MMGGIGNQLFQVARACTFKSDKEEVVLVKITKFKDIIYRYAGWTNHDDWISPEDIANLIEIKVREVTYPELFSLILIYMLRKLGSKSFFDREYCNRKGDIKRFYSIIDVGYFQTINHVSFDSVKLVARTLSQHLNVTKKSGDSTIVAHIRGGDFAEHQRLGAADVKSIIDFAKSKGLTIKIVTNDSDFSSSLFGNLDDVSIATMTGALDDFKCICDARYLYISDSTFSFWAAMCSKSIGDIHVLGPPRFSYADFLMLDVI
jgi:hypothetical protein